MQYTPIYVAKLQKVDHITCIIPKNHQLGALYLGNVIPLIKIDLIMDNQIQSVLTCSVETLRDSDKKQQIINNIKKFQINHRVLNAYDTKTYAIDQHFQESFKFIKQERRKKRNVLVHCHAGRSRSATILIAYLMKQFNYRLKVAYNLVKQKRSCIQPNSGFNFQLQQYQKSLYQQKKQDNKIKSINDFESQKQFFSERSSFISKQDNEKKLSLSQTLLMSEHKIIQVRKRKPLEIKQQYVNSLKGKMKKILNQKKNN